MGNACFTNSNKRSNVNEKSVNRKENSSSSTTAPESTPTNTEESLDHYENHARGTIYGNCVGDAIGLSTEFMSKEEASLHYEKFQGKLQYEDRIEDRHRSRWIKGDWTDDSDQMILIMQSLIENKQVNATDFGQKLRNWAQRGFVELEDKGGCGIGRTTWEVINHRLFKTNPQNASKDVWENVFSKHAAPNGGVMRTSVLGLYQYQNLEAVVENTKQMCTVTHTDPR